MHSDLRVVYGRHEYDCHYYQPEAFKADEIPCLTLTDCPHRVDQETGETIEAGVTPCPYYLAKYNAKQARIVVCTASFYLFTQLFSREFEQPAGLVIDEAHQMANVMRNALSYEITDWNLRRAVDLLNKLGAEHEAWELEQFMNTMVQILRKKPQSAPTILSDEEVWELMNYVSQIDAESVRKKIGEAISSGQLNPIEDREFLMQLESITLNLKRYIRSLEYSMEDKGRNPLNYVTYAYSEREAMADSQRIQYRLIIRAYYVAPLMKRLLAPQTIAYSATVGDPNIFGYETGIKLPFVSLAGTFSTDNTRVLMPNDTPNLATKAKIRQEPTKVLRRIARACYDLHTKQIRALVVVVSNREKDKFIQLCGEENVEVISYGESVTPRGAISRFKAGEGSVLVGTTANYGEGLDLPEEMAPVIFFLRPGYPNPRDPVVQFEERRFGNQRWQVWNWRVMIEALQVRGRNVRSADDRGVTIFISQQFRRFLYGSLPTWLRPSYRSELTLDECRKEIIDLLG
ncbi:MAG TPA: helicase C-terminal domain-containing protein [Candidatus Binatia bacterium]|nr:helicase C-terminal domain-containing protein [Candidatus Binatia bacterium]